MGTKNPNRVAGGYKAKLGGMQHEGWVEAQHEKARWLGIIAHVQHNEPKTKRIGGRLIEVAATVADHTGVLEGGRYLAVEDKSVEDRRFAKNKVTREQQEHLTAVAKAGGLALLVVDFKILVERLLTHNRAAIPWLEVPWKTVKSAEALYLEDIDLKWIIIAEDCYLRRWHNGGPRSNTFGDRIYPAE
jgi:penicillin-binding protein-related factor A (putative recombinase)